MTSSKKAKSKKRNPAVRKFLRERDSAFKRFPLLFTLLGTFGVIATFYGFQHVFESIPLLADHPYIALIVGLVILFATGKLYKKLG